MLTLTPVALATANAFVNAHHRHHKATAGHKFSIGCAKDGELVGVAIVGRPVSRYEAVYTREVYPDDDTGRILENFYYIFNDERPGDFVGHSLSVSDIVALKQDGKVSYHYCDSMGFQELPAFQKPENYLKAAEMSMEDDYGMIDGIINNGPKQPTVADLEAQVKAGMSISLMDLAEAAHREKKKSVLEQLKSQPAQERPHKTAPKKSAEKEL